MSSSAESMQSMTAAELARLPDDGNRRELVEGRLRMMSPAGGEHGRIAMRLALDLGNHVKTNKLGVVFAAETGFVIKSDPDTVRAPDVAFVSGIRLSELPSLEGYLPLAPDFVAEVVSPSDSHSDIIDKTTAWLDAGVRLVLVADPRKRTMQAYFATGDVIKLSGSETLDARDVVSGWKLSAAEVFGQ